MDALRTVGGEPLIAGLPDGLDTEVGERGTSLSAGERQIVAFARALLAEPRILILDEATSNVDVRTEKRIEEGLERLLVGRTAIVIAHRLSTIRRASRIVVLEHGQDRRERHPRGAARARRRLRAPLRHLGRPARRLSAPASAGLSAGADAAGGAAAGPAGAAGAGAARAVPPEVPPVEGAGVDGGAGCVAGGVVVVGAAGVVVAGASDGVVVVELSVEIAVPVWPHSSKPNDSAAV